MSLIPVIHLYSRIYICCYLPCRPNIIIFKKFYIFKQETHPSLSSISSVLYCVHYHARFVCTYSYTVCISSLYCSILHASYPIIFLSLPYCSKNMRTFLAFLSACVVFTQKFLICFALFNRLVAFPCINVTINVYV